MNELQRAAVRLHLADLEEAGQFEEHGALPALPHLQLHEGFGIESGGRRYLGLDLVLRNADRLGLGLFSHDAGGVAGTAAGLAQSECAPHVVVTLTVDRLQLACPDLFRGQGVEVKIKGPKRPSLKPRMQHAVVVGGRFGFRGRCAFRAGCGQRFTEAEEQPQSVELRQVVGGGVPLGQKLLRVLGRTERRLQLGKSVVIETKISGDKFFFQDGRPGEKRHGGPLRLVAGNQQHFALAFKKSPGDMTGDIFGESDGAIVKGDVKGGALQRHFADVIHPRLVESHAAQLANRGLRRSVLAGLRLRRWKAALRQPLELARCWTAPQTRPTPAHTAPAPAAGIILITLVT